MKGKVKFFNEMKGFGFVAGEDGKEYFVHQSALAPGLALRENDVVVFDPEQGDRGPKAANVSLDRPEQPAEEAPAEDAPAEEAAPAQDEGDDAPEEEKQE
ncbi:cold shock domain-containing protein [Candidatus Woesearchaeota archaeon]|nr:cold shock domain-containing protein [Candidatus Woesearchaeota archaeon]